MEEMLWGERRGSGTFVAGSKLTGVPHAAGERPEPIAHRSSTTVAVLMRPSDLLPGGWERQDEWCIDRGDAGALGGIAAGGEGADAAVVHAGTGGKVGWPVS